MLGDVAQAPQKTTWRKLSVEGFATQRVVKSFSNRTFAKQMAVFAAFVVVFCSNAKIMN